MSITIKTPEDIRELGISGAILSKTLKKLKNEAKEGVTLIDLDNKAKEMLIREGAESAFFGYKPGESKRGFPGQICTSVNDQVVHGVPTKYILRDGDVLKIDIGVKYNGYITDAALTIPIGKIPEETERLLRATLTSLHEAIKATKPGNRLGDIGYAVEKTVTKNNFSVIKALGGHGVGFELHEDPTVHNFGDPGTGIELTEGMVLAIEPITTTGNGNIKTGPGESFVTVDGAPSAHFEATVAITKNGCKVLTPWWE